MDQLSARLNEVSAKMQRLLSQHDRVLQEVKAAQQENQELKREVGLRNKTIEELEEKIKTLQIAKNVEIDEDRTVLKQKINDYIREIDRCIALLND